MSGQKKMREKLLKQRIATLFRKTRRLRRWWISVSKNCLCTRNQHWISQLCSILLGLERIWDGNECWHKNLRPDQCVIMLWVYNSLRENCTQIVLRDSASAYGWLEIGHIRKRKGLVMRGSALYRLTSKNALPQPTGQGASSQKEIQYFFLSCWWLHQPSISEFGCFSYIWFCATV